MVNVSRALTPFAQRYITKLKYSQVVTTTATGQYIMNLNSLYDPDRTGIGHQPYGYDVLATIYNKYRVISCGYRLQSPIASTQPPFTMLALPSNDIGITYTTVDDWKENPRCKYLMINPGATCGVLSGKSYLPSLTGVPKATYMADDSYSSDVTTSPFEQMLLYLFTSNASGVALPSIAIHVIMEFTVEWFDVKHIIPS